MPRMKNLDGVVEMARFTSVCSDLSGECWGGSVSIGTDLRSLKRFWNLESGHLAFVVKVDFGPDEPDLEYLTEITAGVRGTGCKPAGRTARMCSSGYGSNRAGRRS